MQLQFRARSVHQRILRRGQLRRRHHLKPLHLLRRPGRLAQLVVRRVAAEARRVFEALAPLGEGLLRPRQGRQPVRWERMLRKTKAGL